MQTMKVKNGDTVQITAGKDRGKQGRVVEAHPGRQKVVVENLNLIRRHQRPRPITNSSRMGGPTMTPGGIIDMPSAIPVGNVMVVCPVCKKPTRVGTVVKDVKGVTRRIRVCKNEGCGQEIDH
jgi:large subunit ribosomal protein L24